MRRAVASGLVVCGLLLPIGAAVTDVTGSFEGAGWIVFALDHAGISRFDVKLEGLRGGGEVDIWLYDGSVSFLGGSSLRRVDGDEFVSLDAGDGPPLVEKQLQTASSTDGHLSLDVEAPPFKGYLLIWSAGDAASTSWSLDAASIVALDSGSRWFLSEAEGFDSDFHLLVKRGGTGVAVQREGRMDIDIEGAFLGVVGTPGPAEGQTISLETVTGIRTCPCDAWHLMGADTVGPGRITIHRDATTIHGGIPPVMIAGVDVTWAPP